MVDAQEEWPHGRGKRLLGEKSIGNIEGAKEGDIRMFGEIKGRRATKKRG